MAKPKNHSLDVLAELLSSKADIEAREREARQRACVDIGMLVLGSGLPISDLWELETLLSRVKKLGMAEALSRLSQRAKSETKPLVDATGLVETETGLGAKLGKELADVAA